MTFSHFRKHISWYLMAISAILATTGYVLYYTINGIAFDFSDLAYAVIQLFLLESNLDFKPINLPLNIARFLAPASLATAVIQGMLNLFSDKIRLNRIKSYKEHIIIYGDSVNNLRLAKDPQVSAKRYVLVNAGLSDENEDDDDSYRMLHMNVEQLNRQALKKIGFYASRYFIVSCESDTRSLMVARELALNIEAEELVKPIDVILVFNNPEWAEYGYELGITEQVKSELSNHKYLKFRYLNYKDTAIRRIMHLHAPDIYSPVISVAEAQKSICIIGYNKITERLLMNLALNSHYINHQKLKVYLFADNQDGFDDFAVKYQLTFTLDIDTLKANEINEFSGNAAAVYITEEEDSKILFAFSVLRRNRAIQKIPRIFISDTDQTAASLIRDENTCFINLADEASVFSNLIDESIDKLAQTIHGDYLLNLQQINPDIPTHRPWDILPDEIRNRNRQQADHMWIKLRSLGCIAVPLDNAGNAYELQHDERLEALSKAEHNRWCAYLYCNGWKLGEKRDDAHKIHTDLVPYEDLSEPIKQYDRNAILNMPHLLHQTGYKIVKKTTP